MKPSCLFCIAWFIFFVGNLLNFVSFSYATQTLLSSLGSVQFIANIIFIYILFKISPTTHQLFGTTYIIFGIILIVLVANKSTFKYDSSQLINLFHRMQYVSYLIVIICLSLIFHSLYLYSIKYALPLSKVNHLIFESDEQSIKPTKISQNENEHHSDSKFHIFLTAQNSKVLIPTFYAFVSAMIGSQSVVLAKSSSFLLIGSQFDDPITYVFIISWCIAMIFWLYRMNHALRSYDGAFIIPILQVFTFYNFVKLPIANINKQRFYGCYSQY